jgi:long-subunit fatty acid transport protein
MKKKILRIVIIGIFILGQNSYSGDANYKSYFGAKTLALNGMYIAGVDGLTAGINNPSSLGYLEGKGLDLTFIAKIGEYTYVNPEKGMYTSYREEDPRAGFGAYWSVTDEATISIGYFPVIDYRIDWPFAMLLGDELNQVILTFEMFNNISVDAISLDLAYSFESFALGVALNAYQIQHQMAFPIATPDWRTDSIMRGAYQFNYDQDAWTYGINLGLSWDISEKFKLGALLRSSYQADLSGTATSNMFYDIALADTAFTGTPPPAEVGMKSKIEFPWIMGIGMIYKASENLYLNIDMQYNLWGSVQNEMSIEIDDQTWNGVLAERDSVTGIMAGSINMPGQNSLEVGLGIEYFSSPDLVFRAGYRFSQSPNKTETFHLAFPTVSQHWLSAGIGFVEENYQINLTVAYAFGVTQEVDKTENEYWYGQYDGQTFIPAISLLYQF